MTARKPQDKNRFAVTICDEAHTVDYSAGVHITTIRLTRKILLTRRTSDLKHPHLQNAQITKLKSTNVGAVENDRKLIL